MQTRNNIYIMQNFLYSLCFQFKFLLETKIWFHWCTLATFFHSGRYIHMFYEICRMLFWITSIYSIHFQPHWNCYTTEIYNNLVHTSQNFTEEICKIRRYFLHFLQNSDQFIVIVFLEHSKNNCNWKFSSDIFIMFLY